MYPRKKLVLSPIIAVSKSFIKLTEADFVLIGMTLESIIDKSINDFYCRVSLLLS